MEQHLYATRCKDKDARDEMAFELSEGSDNNDPVLVDMVENGAAVDIMDAYKMRAHHMKMMRVTDAGEKAKMQREFMLDRAERLRST